MERGVFRRVAFMLTSEKAYPNLHREMVQYHMDNGLRKNINEVVVRKTSVKQNRLLRNGVYAFSSLLGSRRRPEEDYYGFKDELTDLSKHKGKWLTIGIWTLFRWVNVNASKNYEIRARDNLIKPAYFVQNKRDGL